MNPAFLQPEHLHVLLNHLPIIGLPLGALALGLALAMRSRAAQIVALVVVLVSSASFWPVNQTGEQAYKPIRGIADEAGVAWLDTHMERADQAAPAFYLLAALALAALLAPRKWPRSATPLAATTLALALVCTAASGWIALAGGQIRHPEFRDAAPPQVKSATHSH